MDAEGEAEEGADDNALYCFCQEKSYGEMIGCDNEECRFEWVSLRSRLPRHAERVPILLLPVRSPLTVPSQMRQARTSLARDLVLPRLRRRARVRRQQRETETEAKGEEEMIWIVPGRLLPHLPFAFCLYGAYCSHRGLVVYACGLVKWWVCSQTIYV